MGADNASAGRPSRRRRVSPRLVKSIRETAKELGVSELTIRRQLNTGAIQGVQIGGVWRLPGPGIDRIHALPEECTVEQIAHSLVVSVVTVRRWIKSGQFPATKHLHTWLIKRSDLEAILGFDATTRRDAP